MRRHVRHALNAMHTICPPPLGDCFWQAKFEALQTVPTPEPEPDPGRFSYQPALQPNRDPSLTPVRALTPQSLPGAQPQPQQQRQQEEGGDEGRPSWAGARRADADVWGATSSSSSSSSGGTEAAASPSASAAAEPEGRSSSFQFKTHLVVNYDRPLQDVPPAPEPDAAPPKEGASGTDGRAAEAGGRGVLGTASAAAAAADTAAAPPKAPASLAGSNDGGTGGAAGGSLTDWFAKLSLPWGRDRQQQQAAPAGGVGLSRDVSTGSLQQYGQQYGTAAYAPGASSSYAFNEKALEERLTSASGQEQQHYYRCVRVCVWVCVRGRWAKEAGLRVCAGAPGLQALQSWLPKAGWKGGRKRSFDVREYACVRARACACKW